MTECDRNTCKHFKAGNCEAPSLSIKGGICQTFSSAAESVKRTCDCYEPLTADKLCCCGTCQNWLWDCNKCGVESKVLEISKRYTNKDW